jgi:hypothetical protein
MAPPHRGWFAWNAVNLVRVLVGIGALAFGWTGIDEVTQAIRQDWAILLPILPVGLVAQLHRGRRLRESAPGFAHIRRLNVVGGVLFFGTLVAAMSAGRDASQWLAVPLVFGVGALMAASYQEASLPPESFRWTPGSPPAILAMGWLVAIAASAVLAYVVVFYELVGAG